MSGYNPATKTNNLAGDLSPVERRYLKCYRLIIGDYKL